MNESGSESNGRIDSRIKRLCNSQNSTRTCSYCSRAAAKLPLLRTRTPSSVLYASSAHTTAARAATTRMDNCRETMLPAAGRKDRPQMTRAGSECRTTTQPHHGRGTKRGALSLDQRGGFNTANCGYVFLNFGGFSGGTSGIFDFCVVFIGK